MDQSNYSQSDDDHNQENHRSNLLLAAQWNINSANFHRDELILLAYEHQPIAIALQESRCSEVSTLRRYLKEQYT